MLPFIKNKAVREWTEYLLICLPLCALVWLAFYAALRAAGVG